MHRTLTLTVAGKTSTSYRACCRWERLIDAVAADQGYSITHSVVARFGSRSRKFTLKKRLSPRGRPVRWFELAAVPDPFITIIQDALLYASLSRDGASLTIAARGIRVGPFVKSHLEALRKFVTHVEGYAAFLLPSSELAANYVTGMNDVRECARAKVLEYKSGGFLA